MNRRKSLKFLHKQIKTDFKKIQPTLEYWGDAYGIDKTRYYGGNCNDFRAWSRRVSLKIQKQQSAPLIKPPLRSRVKDVLLHLYYRLENRLYR